MAKHILSIAPLLAGAAGPIVQIADVVVPEIFTPYVQQLTEEKSRIISSGVAVRDGLLDDLLAGGGLTFNVPSWQDLDNDEENIATDDIPHGYTGGVDDPDPKKIGSATEIAVRMNRHQSWAASNLAAQLAGNDPMESIAQRVANYWARRLQAAFIATMGGIFADNDAAPSGGDTHTQGDLTVDISGASYVEGETDFSAAAFLDAAVTMGDSMEDLQLVAVHSIVYNRMQKNNLIDFIPDARGETTIPTFLGRTVIVDDGVPSPSNGVFETWMFGAGAVRLGIGTPNMATETERKAGAGNGSGADVLHNRVLWTIHPTGHAYKVASPAAGGPSNAATAGNLANADSWTRVYSERKQIKIARLITREF